MLIKIPCLLFLKIITLQEVLRAYCLSNELTRLAYSCAYLVSMNPAEIKSLGDQCLLRLKYFTFSVYLFLGYLSIYVGYILCSQFLDACIVD